MRGMTVIRVAGIAITIDPIIRVRIGIDIAITIDPIVRIVSRTGGIMAAIISVYVVHPIVMDMHTIIAVQVLLSG
jgi:hypothetical protein